MYASLCDFVCIALLSPFVLGFCLSVFCLFVWLVFYTIVLRACYHWWICFLVWLLSSFFLFLSLLLFNFFIFNNYFILITLFILFFFLSFFLPFLLSCVADGLGAPAGCQVCASEVGEPSSGHRSTRDLLAPCNIKW